LSSPSDDVHAPADARLLFLLGVAGRSGTNFLHDLLRLHPDCVFNGRDLGEDFLLAESGRLAGYARAVDRRLAGRWGAGAQLRADVRGALGDGLARFLTGGARADALVLAKTPSVDGLEHFFDFFPRARLLVLVRDGRATVETGVRSFGWDREDATRNWAIAVRRVLAFQEAQRERADRFMVIRYEDLLADQRERLGEVLAFAGLDPARYDFAAARALPVRGSTELRGEAGGLHWKPVEKSGDFKPPSRFEGWTAARHRRFNWIAGRELERFGYAPHDAGDGALPRRFWNVLLDGWSFARRAGCAVMRRVRR
jgi:hypothetical protein